MSGIIKVDNLGKRYTIQHEHPERYIALRDVIANKVRKIYSFPKSLNASGPTRDFEEFWALKDLNFEIQQGARVGIIGRNGAGKSTLLKILSRITEPSIGKVELHGRVASLLEVGTGFHPELTGRENIFLNGAILGMSRVEIRKKFDEIVDFSGVEKFLDTPVKRYSSGMYVRLAFAVAAHLEPEILVVDEVLAVGDAEFQKKCLGKMEEVSKEYGRTVLFVSHNLRAIQGLCEDVLVMDRGKSIFSGNKTEGLLFYEKTLKNKSNQTVNKHGEIFQLSTHLSNERREINPQTLTQSDELSITIEFESTRNFENSYVNICIDGQSGERIVHIRNDWDQHTINIFQGKNSIKVTIKRISLAPGIYDIWARIVLGADKIIIDSEAHSFEVVGKALYGLLSLDASWHNQ